MADFLSPLLSDPSVIDGLRATYRDPELAVVFLDGALLPAAASLLRVQVAPRMVPFAIADRGCYGRCDSLASPALFARLRDVAAAITGQRLSLGLARWLRFAHRDYTLHKGDDAAHLPPHVELTLDLSRQPVPDAEVSYSDGARAIALPHGEGQLALVERRSGLHRAERYLTHRAGDREVFRLRLSLLPE